MARRRPDRAWLAVGAITAVAAVLRLVGLGAVQLDPFYDAAVRSMGLSWHNFFFGAFEPSASVSIDKPPVDLWLQVVSVKLLGFNSTSLKLPEALGGTASVPLLFAAVRRLFGVRAGLAAAVAIAVMPIEVLTSRSDTMDAVMMALIALSLLLVVMAADSGSLALLLLGAAALGLAFDVKLLEALVPLPGLVVFAYMALPGTRRRRLLHLAAAAAVYVAVALSWLTATLAFPAHDRPFAIGSTNGSAWNAAFVFNGYDRITGKATAGDPITFGRNRRYPTATQSERDHIPITPPSPTRLLARIGPLSGERLGLEVLAALLLGVPALIAVLSRRWVGRPGGRVGGAPPASILEAAGESDRTRVTRGAAAGLLVWLATGIVLFSEMARLHPRYVEGFTPAVAAVLGIGVAWVTAGRGPVRLALLAGAVLVVVVYAAHLLYGTIAVWWLTLLAGLGAVVLAALAGGPAVRDEARRWLTAGALTLTLLCVLAIPAIASISAINEKVSDAGHVGEIPAAQQRLISRYLRAHQGTARYEVAVDSATRVGSLVVADARPVLVLTTYAARTLTGVARLRQLIAQGQVRYALLGNPCGRHTPSGNASCSAPVRWIRAHSTDVSAQAGLPRSHILWRLETR